MADLLTHSLGLDSVELVSGHRGEFSVWVGERCVARKNSDGYPDENVVLETVREALS